ncbi:heme A synthase [Youhaiella tibetensis]|uniref:Heme A synthase n=1 Tax=Paradevosia tibetensis TaxID=1447062 RepID=A0A5B9DP22_9HYPH|nr:COX15/CtaA family protein [Youhaiella tibetensis]QEE20449.1 heme A synthase [Youhaiella tibetensis]GGF24076.1 heme A synthase [Youhaiella tibetensis]
MASIDTTTSISNSKPADRMRPVRTWLYCIALLVLIMVAVGGITRLTGSGLSITSWKPISGIIPPLTDADWQAEYEGYRQIPQFQVNNHWMSVEDFKSIFWWEWIHRFLGRMIGFAFAIPFVVFLVQKRFSWNLAGPLAALFVLGGLQGALGWWMVSSGLSELTSVSQYRLAAHLSAAALLFMALVSVARSLEPEAPKTPVRSVEWWGTVALLVLIFVQLIAGAFVAGLDAGFGYNTWPLMGDSFVPPGMASLDPFWKNIFENTTTVQFIHRCIAYLIVIYLGFRLWQQSRAGGFGGVHQWLPRLAGLILFQVALGITTLLMVIPIELAVAHQVTAFILLGTTIAYLTDMRRAPRV